MYYGVKRAYTGGEFDISIEDEDQYGKKNFQE
jgi:hypothetical protein